MADVLSQSEIDALLSAISTGEMNAEELLKEEDQKKEKVYDFKRALRFSKDQFRSLTRIHENYARLLTSYFSARLRTYVQISVASVDQLPYEEFVRSVPSLTILNVFEAQPLSGRMVIEVNPNIAYAMLDRLLGGVGESFNKIDNLTEIESKLISQIFESALEPYKDAWATVFEIEPEMQDFEVNTQFLQMASPNETVVVISLQAQIGEASGMINICLPHVSLEPAIPNLSLHQWMVESSKDATPEDATKMKLNVQDASVEVQAELGETKLTINDFIDLNVNDVIPLYKRIDDPIVVKVGSYPKFTAQPGLKNKHMAIQILDVIEEGSEDV
ncbi:flagellar motor switch protein FliM [Pullulanibacillus pueri]|uniref:Flagellar motor switch protein FliM n=1 Tax=Pullulanibacillus pueri TaxID=1437324 RepID=A0A8J2ZWP5_9BACL|nr:flagellar motor switch protein FliM [Pullulanibacillus pueri]MBM7682486.1 flagellar motor switch protein FliM [Pullulanibacillus pueri]GGH82206.1 flagellar motor switch protein FliM [Pullulanibacillus pueri]